MYCVLCNSTEYLRRAHHHLKQYLTQHPSYLTMYSTTQKYLKAGLLTLMEFSRIRIRLPRKTGLGFDPQKILRLRFFQYKIWLRCYTLSTTSLIPAWFWRDFNLIIRPDPDLNFVRHTSFWKLWCASDCYRNFATFKKIQLRYFSDKEKNYLEKNYQTYQSGPRFRRGGWDRTPAPAPQSYAPRDLLQ